MDAAVKNLRRRLDLLAVGGGLHRGVYDVRSATQEQAARQQALARGDECPIIIWRYTPLG
jgi:hypothetical protein